MNIARRLYLIEHRAPIMPQSFRYGNRRAAMGPNLGGRHEIDAGRGDSDIP